MNKESNVINSSALFLILFKVGFKLKTSEMPYLGFDAKLSVTDGK